MQKNSFRKIATAYMLGATWLAILVVAALAFTLALSGVYDSLGVSPLLRMVSTMTLAAITAGTTVVAMWRQIDVRSPAAPREPALAPAPDTTDEREAVLAPIR